MAGLKLWNYLLENVEVIDTKGRIYRGYVYDFVDEVDNEEEDEINIDLINRKFGAPLEITLYESQIKSIQILK
ncbi:hypothetical protein CIRMBP1320_01888 [Enterococcus cecorum]|nr:hypothetical protein CIRMBP1320_01888 [Enterococcus cecorum]